MVNFVSRVLFGGTRFTTPQSTYLRSRVRAGASREVIRGEFRAAFGRGLPNAAFADIRRTLSVAERTGAEALRLAPSARIRRAAIPTIKVVSPRSRYVVATRVRARIHSTGEIVERFVRFGTNRIPSRNEITARANEIIALGIKQANSAMQVDDYDSLEITAYEEA